MKNIIFISIFIILITPSLIAQSTCNVYTNGDQTICRGQSIEICANGADSYYWSTGEQSNCITVSPDHTKTYSVTGLKNGCEADTHFTISVDEFNMPSSADYQICTGESVEICADSSDSADNYYWDVGKITRCITVSPNETTTYSVIGSKNGCEDSDYIKVNVKDSFSLQTGNNPTICAGEFVEICVNGANYYWWSNGKEGACITVNPHKTTTYQVVGNKNGCEATAQVTVFVEDSLQGDCSDSKFGLTDATGEWYLEHENQTHTKFYVGNDEKMIIQNNGRVGIGTDTAMYKLDVCGTIRAVEVLVEDDWCDYVFDKDYTLPSLEEEKKHIEKNGYLLGFESEEAMSGKISLHDVTKRQQVKIEEYALQLIQLDEKNKDLTKKYKKLEAILMEFQK